MDLESRRQLQVLEAVAQDERLTQRRLSARLGIALGLTNIYLKRMVRKGYIKCVNVRSNRLLYLLTPSGIAEKTRLTYEFMQYSAIVLRHGRSHLKAMLRPYAAPPGARIAIYGTDEAAELAYLCLRELGLQPVAVFDEQGGREFLGLPVKGVEAHASLEYDVMVVATFADPTAILERLGAFAIPPQKLVTLRPPLRRSVSPFDEGGDTSPRRLR